MNKRICCIGTPRSGSQYITQMIANTISNKTGQHVYNMLEPFTLTAKYIPVFEPGSNRLMHQEIFHNIEYPDRVKYVMDVIDRSDPYAPLVMKIFPYPYVHECLFQILDFLKKKNFEFVILKRKNIEAQLLSWAVAYRTQKWNAFKEDDIVNNPVEAIDLESVVHLFEFIRDFDKICKEYGLVDIPVVYYETAVEDLSRLYRTEISTNVHFLKQGKEDPYELISNKEEVRELIKRLLNGN